MDHNTGTPVYRIPVFRASLQFRKTGICDGKIPVFSVLAINKKIATNNNTKVIQKYIYSKPSDERPNC